MTLRRQARLIDDVLLLVSDVSDGGEEAETLKLLCLEHMNFTVY